MYRADAKDYTSDLKNRIIKKKQRLNKQLEKDFKKVINNFFGKKLTYGIFNTNVQKNLVYFFVIGDRNKFNFICKVRVSFGDFSGRRVSGSIFLAKYSEEEEDGWRIIVELKDLLDLEPYLAQ